MKNPETHTCHKCGYTWKHGHDGSHSCSDRLEKQVKLLKERVRESNKIIHDQIVVMQCALIDAVNNGHEKGLKWIYNELWPPGNLADENDEWFYDANLYYCAHRADPMGPCEICGKPSSRKKMKHVACCDEHLKEALEKSR